MPIFISEGCESSTTGMTKRASIYHDMNGMRITHDYLSSKVQLLKNNATVNYPAMDTISVV